MLNQKDKAVFDEFKHRVYQQFPDAEIIAFGSRARGDASIDSDFDICVVLNHADAVVKDFISDIAWETGFENDRIITTVVMDNYQFKKGPMSASSLVKNIIKEGVHA